MSEIIIRKWKEEFAQDFIDLSMEWLTGFDFIHVEPGDTEQLYHPHESILDNGGMIFFASNSDKNVGTVSMVRINDDTYELAKMAVTEKYRGRHIGGLLMETALAYGREHKAKKVILFTNSGLKSAIHLYHRYGFYDVPLTDAEYEGADTRMEKDL